MRNVLDGMSSPNIDLCTIATRVLSNTFNTRNIIASKTALELGYFNRIVPCLNRSGQDEVVKEALWGLSNLVADGAHISFKFWSENLVVNRIMVLSSSSNWILRAEATWVLTNAIRMSSEEEKNKVEDRP